ncbi:MULTISPECIES: DUF1700 domain-containing protein [unclassified Breznakia]|uniref:DUF1700 domain-containing protein n=1 Tax=unclassified Breznakia TaxID=2623764 RepID=UPI00247544BD|nr:MULTISPECIES: DUF1700 domain-containing protein [unclassified Breznakia]MDH6366188.1 putative membrane protein [Breznakia sp. PH1-1]MDH6403281.1 putative membrane protein [Breznakia sp. PF1-11]MDH6410990.1 putative membrane protein [Breznakia sp. PFB1-11]MDH6413354.1 putative membrane protein [Breznakia sp. PFB1-14]MDH6416119.1 putative membrane protein [Breznakia sp. PFB1-4]
MENMTKQQYITKLSFYLRGMEESEYEDVMNYIQEYFEDAGIENEQSVMEELGSPQKLAATLRAEATIKSANNKREEAESNLQQEKQKNSTLKTILIIVLGIFALPIALPLAIAMIAVIFALFAVLVSMVIVVVVMIVALFIVGIPNVVHSISLFSVSIADGLVALGASLMMIGAGLLMALVVVAIISKFIPWMVRQLTKIFNRHNSRPHLNKEGHIYDEK